MNTYLKTIVLWGFFPFFLNAQETNVPSADSSSFVKKHIILTGDIGVYGELYSMNGQPDRRPPATGRIFFRPTLNLFGVIQLPFNFLLSSEGSSTRQNINQFSINPKWKWGSLHAGDFTEDYSQFSLSGIKIRGGGLNLNPAKFRFSAAAGFTQQSVPGGAQNGSYKRLLYATKIGYGNPDKTYIDLIFLQAKDDVNSLTQDEKTITIISPNGNDVLKIGSLQSIRWNSFGIDGAVKIELSRDGGTTFELLADNQPNVGFFNWTVSGTTTFQALVKVTSTTYTGIFDVSDFVFTIGTGVETYIASNPNEIINPYAVTPQENLLIGTRGKISLYENHVSLEFDGAGSAYTRDLRATELNADSVNEPSFITTIFTPRVGTNYDFALNTFLNLTFKSFNTKVGFKNIGPGYNSLGTAYLLNDIREYSIMNFVRLGRVGFSLGYINQSDNLIDQKQYTTARNIITSGLNAPVTSYWNTSFSVNYLSMKNNSENDTTKTDFGSFVISTNQSFLIKPSGFFRNLNLNYSFQNSNNQSYMVLVKSVVNTCYLSAGISPMRDLTSTLSAGFVSSTVFDTVNTFTHNYSILLQLNKFSNKLVTSLNFTTAFSESNKSFRTILGSAYRFSKKDNIGISISYINFNGSSQSGGNFKEFMANLNYSHRF